MQAQEPETTLGTGGSPAPLATLPTPIPPPPVSPAVAPAPGSSFVSPSVSSGSTSLFTNGSGGTHSLAVEPPKPVLSQPVLPQPALPAPAAAAAEPAQESADELRFNAAVFDHLVDADSDVTGLVAYGLYKLEKRDWLVSWQDQRGLSPSAAQFDAFLAANLTQGQRARYRGAARQVLERHAAESYRTEAPATSVAEDAAERLDAAIRKVEQGTRLGRVVFAGAIGAAIVLILAGGGLFYLARNGGSLQRLLAVVTGGA